MLSSSTRPLEPCDHEIAPNGDVVLVLKNANAPFAVCDDPTAPPPASIQTESLSSAGSIRFLVSSSHLKSASPVFSAALTGPWNESVLTRDGHHQITAEDWDVEALLIVLNLVHGRNSRVPKTVTIELLCKISVLADYYRVHEAVRFPRLLWIDSLRVSVPQTYGRELVLWLCVSWIFQDDDIFEAVTKTAILESTEEVSALQLPISAVVIDEINSHRAVAFATLEAFLEDLQTGFINGTKGCTFECQALLLGALMKKMVASGILELGKGWYFRGMSVTEAVHAVEAIEPLDTRWRRAINGVYHENCRFSLGDVTRTFARSVMDEAKPLELKALRKDVIGKDT